jgi:hypothetical protein
MSLLLGLFLVVHGGVHIGFLCSRSWPFAAGDSWLVAGLGAGPDAVNTIAAALVIVTFVAFLLAGLTAAAPLPRAFWAPLVTVASIASAIVLVVFVTPGTLPGLAIDAVLLWTALSGARPTPFFGRHDDRERPGIAHRS